MRRSAKRKQVPDDLESLTEEQLDWLGERADTYGIWVRKSDLPKLEDYNPEYDGSKFNGLVEQNRLAELKKGARPTPEEFQEYQDHWRDEILFGGMDLDHADYIPGYALVKVRDSEGGMCGAFVLRTGTSLSGLRTWFGGIFRSEDDARSLMNNEG